VSLYFWLKTAHVLSSIVLLGTGLGIAFFKWAADRSNNLQAIRVISERVVWADWCFTAPAVVVQPVTGILLARLAGFPLSSDWLSYSLILFAVAGACWIPVVWLQIRMRDLARLAVREGKPLDSAYWRYARTWFWLGVPAFSAVIAIVALMVFKPA
jgi:uncharacterized membrane protein